MSYATVSDYLYRTDTCGVTGYPYTFAGWIYLTSTADSATAMCFGDWSADAYQHVYLDSAGFGQHVDSTAKSLTPASSVTAQTSTTYSTGTWHHFAYVCASNTSHTVYLDAAGAATGATSVTFDPGLDSFSLAARRKNGSVGLGWTYLTYFAECAIWDAALDSDAITELAGGLRPTFVNPDDVVAYWPLTSDANDAFASYDLTEVGDGTFEAEHPTITDSYDEGTLAVSAAATVDIVEEVFLQSYDEGTLSVSAAATVDITGESFTDASTFPEGRPTDYDPDTTWDEETGAWLSTYVNVVRNRAVYFIAIGEQGHIYFDEDA